MDKVGNLPIKEKKESEKEEDESEDELKDIVNKNSITLHIADGCNNGFNTYPYIVQ